MAVRITQDSRHRHAYETTDPDGYHYLAEDEPFAYEDRPDNTHYEVREGDTWQSIAGSQFAGLVDTRRAESFRSRRKPSGLFWVIMDFQPEPCLDPTTAPAPGTVLVLPSLRCYRERIQDPDRRRYA